MRPALIILMLAVTLPLSPILSTAAVAQTPTLDDIIRSHAQFVESIHSARITGTGETTLSPARLEKAVKMGRMGSSLSEDARPADFDETHRLQATPRHEFTEMFDTNSGSYKRVYTDLRDIDALIADHRLGDYARTSLNKTFMRARFDSKSYFYDSGPDRLTIHTADPARPPSPNIIITTGLLSIPESSQDVSIRLDPSNSSRYLLTFAEATPYQQAVFDSDGRPYGILRPSDDPPKLHEYVLDPSIDFRVLSHRVTLNDVTIVDASYEYADYDGYTFPRSMHSTMDADDGSFSSSYSCNFTSAQFNIPLASSDFALDVPLGATVNDQTNSLADSARRQFVDRAQNLIPDVYPPPADPSLTEEVPLPPAEDSPAVPPVPDAPTRPYSPLTPEPTRDRTLLLVLSLAAALVIAFAAFILIRKGSKK